MAHIEMRDALVFKSRLHVGAKVSLSLKIKMPDRQQRTNLQGKKTAKWDVFAK